MPRRLPCNGDRHARLSRPAAPRARPRASANRDRTGTGTLSVFGHQMRFDLAEGFPLVTTKKLHLKSIVHELLWFLAGDTNVALPQGARRQHLGRMGRRARRSRPGLRQAMALLGEAGRRHGRPDPLGARRDPAQSRIRGGSSSSAWNPADLDQMALAPCHCLFQFYVADGQALLPALPALGRHLPRRAVQYRQLRAADRTWWRR